MTFLWIGDRSLSFSLVVSLKIDANMREMAGSAVLLKIRDQAASNGDLVRGNVSENQSFTIVLFDIAIELLKECKLTLGSGKGYKDRHRLPAEA